MKISSRPCGLPRFAAAKLGVAPISEIVKTDPHAWLDAREINIELRNVYKSMSSGLHIDTSQNVPERRSNG
jgi:hypothetical protein